MERIYVAGGHFLDMTLNEIIQHQCPHDFDASLEDCDKKTYCAGDNMNPATGCREITCEECWHKEY